MEKTIYIHMYIFERIRQNWKKLRIQCHARGQPFGGPANPFLVFCSVAKVLLVPVHDFVYTVPVSPLWIVIQIRILAKFSGLLGL
jgi:hypothetical protein